jgi:small lipoprotein (TIGR04454 family)
MRAFCIVLASVVSAVGCGAKSDCDGAIRGAVDRMVSASQSTLTPDGFQRVAEVAPAMKDALVKSCTDDKWDKAVIACYADAKSQADMNGCDAKLTPEQQQHRHERTDPILQKAMPAQPAAH